MVSPPEIKPWLIKVEVLERVLVHTRMVSLPEIKLWLLPLLIQSTDSDTADQAAVIEGCDAKDITAAQAVPTRPTVNYLHFRSVPRLPTGTKPKVLTMTKPILKIFTGMMAN